jgi:hypothetical protein
MYLFIYLCACGITGKKIRKIRGILKNRICPWEHHPPAHHPLNAHYDSVVDEDQLS